VHVLIVSVKAAITKSRNNIVEPLDCRRVGVGVADVAATDDNDDADAGATPGV